MHQNLSLYLTLLLHAIVFSLLYSVPLCDYATIYLLLMGLWEVFCYYYRAMPTILYVFW